MGTRGFKSYRHKGRYFVRYNHFDSYPSGLGVQVLATIPTGDPQAFQAWLERTRAQLDTDYKELEGTEDGEYFVRDKQPVNDLFIEWIYEIDLDRLVFLVDTEPVFRLDNMPPEDVFLRCIGFDHYGHRASIEDTPEEYCYDWTAPAPLVDDAALEAYATHKKSEVSAAKLLSVGSPSDGELVNTQLLEVLVGNIMKAPSAAHSIRLLENVAGREELTEQMRDLAVLMPCLALLPRLFPHPDLKRPENVDAIWLRRNVVLRVATHLDDERNMQAAIAALVSAIMGPDEGEDIVYGVAFSIFHCVLVRVDRKAGGSYDHTPALQFLPSFYATSPSTPGITALARLGFRHDPDMVERTAQWLERSADISVSSLAPFKVSPAAVITALDKLPIEILERIAQQLTRSVDLLHLAHVSERCKQIAGRVLRAPLVNIFRLTQALEDPEDEADDKAAGGADEENEDDDDDDEAGTRKHPTLSAQSFAAICDEPDCDREAFVNIGKTRSVGDVLRSSYIRLPRFVPEHDLLRLPPIPVMVERMPPSI
ncbi:hypothetical protein PLICRDRAFT_45062 [Plicaturopsis crispa FD-325 SS-3]|nr:hypothetical protein PLICRDRAFT_45062 [Plicaturopsis crispa FD-325 SS-3]